MPIEQLLGSGRARQRAVIVAESIIFGLGPLFQGPLGVFNASVIGMLFGWAWFRSVRNLWATILAYALVDPYGIGMLFLGRYA
jgi:membrane protease YdiL (CAAX protease family)